MVERNEGNAEVERGDVAACAVDSRVESNRRMAA